jgi:hypothetical protein
MNYLDGPDSSSPATVLGGHETATAASRIVSPGESVTSYDREGILRFCGERASTYCAFEAPDHSAAEHRAIEARLFHIVEAALHDAVNEVHADRAKLLADGTPDAEVPDLLWEMRG